MEKEVVSLGLRLVNYYVQCRVERECTPKCTSENEGENAELGGSQNYEGYFGNLVTISSSLLQARFPIVVSVNYFKQKSKSTVWARVFFMGHACS